MTYANWGSKFTKTFRASFPVSGGCRTASVSEVFFLAIRIHRLIYALFLHSYHNICTTVIPLINTPPIFYVFMADDREIERFCGINSLHCAVFNMAAPLTLTFSLACSSQFQRIVFQDLSLHLTVLFIIQLSSCLKRLGLLDR